jgi:hypothetical protein
MDVKRDHNGRMGACRPLNGMIISMMQQPMFVLYTSTQVHRLHQLQHVQMELLRCCRLVQA